MATTSKKPAARDSDSKSKQKTGQPSDAGKKNRDNDIDSIFAEKKRKQKEEKVAIATQIKKKPKREASSNGDKKGNLSILEKEFGPGASNGWRDDGLGGKFNSEGYTGRVEDGVKVFKAHVLNKPNFGSSKDCPFDCQCCFI